jgi:hydrogenase nickel incorporation protein HypB
LYRIENVGNLACPSSYDLGEGTRFVLFSVRESGDKPLEYSTMFTDAHVVIISRSDFSAAVEFDETAAKRNIQADWPETQVFKVPGKTSVGMTEYLELLETRRVRFRAAAGVAK